MAPTGPGLNSREIIEILYRGALGREADPEGLASNAAILLQTGDVRRILESLVSSDEATERSRSCATLGVLARRELGRAPVVIDVGAQELEAEEHVYSALWTVGAVNVYGFDPLAERIEQRRHADEGKPGTTTLFPVAVGDGEQHDLYINNDDSTTSLFPLDLDSVRGLEHLEDLRTERVIRVPTARLDDLHLPDRIDLVKLDTQGGELMALEAAVETLGRTATVHCEVEFRPIYRGQPLMHDISRFLLDHGFALIDLFPKRYRYTGAAIPSRDQLMWADACFMRESVEPATLVSQALVAALVYSKPNLSEHLIMRARITGDS